jgi:cell wall-associated NlpC family hydrolase
MSLQSFDAACTADVASVRAEPTEGAEQVTQALRGEPLAVVERRGGWVRVRTAYDYEGWVPEAALAGDVLAEARRFLGVAYEWGGMTELGIDCSGLVHMAFRGAGRLVPRDAWQQEEAGEAVDEADARAGDLVSYGADDVATHVAFWLGDGRILHSTQREGVGRVVEELEPDDLRLARRRFIRFGTR